MSDEKPPGRKRKQRKADEWEITKRDLAPGQKLFQRYALVKVLGRGGMGIVWLAIDEELERHVALKFLSDQIIHDHGVLADLKRETRRSLELTHPHIVRIYDFIQDGHYACISMEFVDGETLSGLRSRKPNNVLDTPDLEPWLADWCQAMHYAHTRARIVHCDLKPANLMVNSKGALKITDFGIAKSLSESISTFTMVRGKSGTLVYMSPQQLNGDPPSVMDDIYSMGATLYELLTSKPPFYRGQIDRQIFDKIPPSIAVRRAELGIKSPFIVPLRWEETIAACLAKEPSERPQGAAEIFKRLSLISPLQVDRPPSIPPKAVSTLEVPANLAHVKPEHASRNERRVFNAVKRTISAYSPIFRRPVLVLLVGVSVTAAVTLTWYTLSTQVPTNPTVTRHDVPYTTASQTPSRRLSRLTPEVQPLNSPQSFTPSVTPLPSASLSTTTAFPPSKAELEAMYDKAFREFNANNYSQALKELDIIDARQPNLVEALNLRGVILMRAASYDQAEAVLRKALATDPKFWNARFNLAEIPFLRKDWDEARRRFERLLEGSGAELQGESAQLIQYKILLTYLVEGKEKMVDAFLSQFKVSPETPAFYYANAAVSLQHGNLKEANDWLVKAEKNFSPQRNKLFIESLYELGWKKRPVTQTREPSN